MSEHQIFAMGARHSLKTEKRCNFSGAVQAGCSNGGIRWTNMPYLVSSRGRIHPAPHRLDRGQEGERIMGWNPKVPEERRYPGKMTPGRSAPPTHVVCHITGTNSFETVRKEFTTSASAHYVIDKEGVLYQFVEEENQAWHSGIKASVQTQYDERGNGWRKLLYHFDWAKYPADSVWLDSKLKPVPSRPEATFVGRPGDLEWTEYEYFRARW